MKIIYFTYFDSRYLPKGLALIGSLRSSGDVSKIIVLCLDDQSYEYCSSLMLENVTWIPLGELERFDGGLLIAKENRNLVEFYFTITSCLAFYITEVHSHSDSTFLTYVDADLYFYSSPLWLYKYLENANIIITPHDFPIHLSGLKRHGEFNVGFIAWKLNKIGRECIKNYRLQCLEWCYDKVEGRRYADQGYLSDWPSSYDGVCELWRIPINVSYWNYRSYKAFQVGDNLYLNGFPLIAWHFSGLKTHDYSSFIQDHYAQEILWDERVANLVYRPYIDNLVELNRRFIQIAGTLDQRSLSRTGSLDHRYAP